MDCIAFSVLTDECDPANLKPIDIEDIMASAKKTEQSLIILVKTYFLYNNKKTMNYLEVTKDVYKEAALTPDVGLCCTTTPILAIPELIHPNHHARNELRLWIYSSPRDLINGKNTLCWRRWRHGCTGSGIFPVKKKV